MINAPDKRMRLWFLHECSMDETGAMVRCRGVWGMHCLYAAARQVAEVERLVAEQGPDGCDDQGRPS